jgi:prepilin-type N-terminal cleavage/methylation domain-containing protein
MKSSVSKIRNHGMTLLEVIVVVTVVVSLFVLLLWLALSKMRAHDQLIRCTNNLKQVGLAAYVWKRDHGDKLPMALSETNGGTMEFITGANAWRHFQVMSNELSTPTILFCPAESDRGRTPATNFSSFGNANLSYFVGVDATNSIFNAMLSGDHNITNGLPLKNGILELPPKQAARWTSKQHKQFGIVVLADGSVQMIGTNGLRSLIDNPPLMNDSETNVIPTTFTNRLQIPVLNP